MAIAPSASYSFTIRLEIRNRPGMLKTVAVTVAREVARAAHTTGVACRRPAAESDAWL